MPGTVALKPLLECLSYLPCSLTFILCQCNVTMETQDPVIFFLLPFIIQFHENCVIQGQFYFLKVGRNKHLRGKELKKNHLLKPRADFFCNTEEVLLGH